MRVMARLWALLAMAAWSAVSCSIPVRPAATSFAWSSRMRSISDDLFAGRAPRGEGRDGRLEQPARLEQLAHRFPVRQDDQGQRLDQGLHRDVAHERALPRPGSRSSPRLCSARSASRTEVRLTMNFSARSRSGGSRSPDLSLPSAISCLTWRTISS